MAAVGLRFEYQHYAPLTPCNVAKEIASYLTELYPDGLIKWNSRCIVDTDDDGFAFFVTAEDEKRWDAHKHAPAFNSQIIFVSNSAAGVADPGPTFADYLVATHAEAHPPHAFILHERRPSEIDFDAIHQQLLQASDHMNFKEQ